LFVFKVFSVASTKVLISSFKDPTGAKPASKADSSKRVGYFKRPPSYTEHARQKF
jgi:hypothetical protein